MNKLIISALLVFGLVGMIGTAAADPYDALLYNALGTAPAVTPIDLQPGASITLSYHAEKVANKSIGDSIPYWYNVTVISDGSLGELNTDIAVSTPTYFIPTAATYTDVGVITITNNGPIGAVYNVEIGASGGIVSFDTGSASRPINSIPEFPTVALPIAAIIGLMFIISSRKKEE
ncbi:MAG: PEF-CTERM sorting domain-containing protein [Methanosarcinales archaeon]|nr:PEF-CTERM sorting domain-containing protein [ANME-2 cluster archaeon]MDW7775656.1 PEF-CTERM sorting domain-containing protein [Methanosarcinales archaeon]